ncbi:MAG: sigma-70 family RNA polymerase sigma factor [Bacteroidales bacterium]|nr:sigma-70 family RNA polymerase sigma factor [Bacteroidales bacterium]
MLNRQNDEELISRYKTTQEKEIIGELFDRYIHLVFSACMKFFRHEENARDAAMEIFESLEEKLVKYDIANFKGWLYTTARNHCLMGLRKIKPEVHHEKIENLQKNSVENEGILHLDIEQQVNSELVLKLLDELKHEQRICVELMYLCGKSYKDIAEETGFGLKNVKSFIQNGKRNLRIMIGQSDAKH